MAALDTHAAATSPAYSAAVLSEHDTNELSYMTRAVYVAVTGDVVVTMSDNVDCTFSAVPAGTILPIRIRRLKTASTATVVGMW